jgi:dienelactone hydrolase
MAEALLFHHAHGQTTGFLAFADKLRAAGHTIHTPDLYAGQIFESLDDGVAHADAVGFDEIIRRGTIAAQVLPPALVYMGFSLGTLPAQALTQTRAGALGAVLLHGGEPVEQFAAPWPAGVPLQMHTMDADEWVEIEVLRQLTREIPDAELYIYPGTGHLFADSSLGDYDEQAEQLLVQRTIAFLERCN